MQVPNREARVRAVVSLQLVPAPRHCGHVPRVFVVLFILGYRLSGNIVGALEEINSTSIGVTLATIAMTLIGLFSIMVALILYIMGKQVEQIQSQYDWPSRT